MNTDDQRRHKDNPAGRLYLVLNAIWKIGKGEKNINAWKTALKVEGQDMSTLLSRISAVYKLPAQIRALVPLVEPLRTLATVPGALNKTETVLGQYYSGNVERFQQRLTSNTLDTLQAISSILSASPYSEPVLEDEFLDGIRTEIKSVYEQIQNASDIAPEERHHLLNLLDLLSNAIVEIDIGGAEVLRSAANEVAGTMLSEFPMSGPSPWRDLVATLALGIAVNIGSATVTNNVLPPIEDWMSQVPTIYQLEPGEIGEVKTGMEETDEGGVEEDD